MLRALFAALVVTVGAAAAAAYFALFIVHVNEQAIVLEFGKPVRIISEPSCSSTTTLAERPTS